MQKIFGWLAGIASVCFICLVSNVSAQQNRVDSLRRALANTGQDSLRVETLFALVQELARTPQTARYREEACKLTEKINYRRGIARCLDAQGSIARDSSNYLGALDYHQRALSMAELLNDSLLIATTLNNIGIDYRRMDKYSEGIEYQLNALKIAEATGNRAIQSSALAGIGTTYRQLKKEKEALPYFERALALERNGGTTVGVAASLTNVGNIYFLLGQNDKAMEYTREALPLHYKSDNQKGVAICLNLMGGICMQEKKHREALTYFLKALEIDIKLGDKRYIAESNSRVGEAYSYLGNYPLALTYLERGLNVAMQINSKSKIQVVCQKLSDTHSRIGNHKQALEFYRKSILYKDSIFNEENNHTISGLQARLENEKQQAQIKLLKKDREKQKEVHAAQIKQQRMIGLAMTAVLGSIAVAALVLFRNNRRKQRINTHLTQLNSQVSLQKEEIEAQRDNLESQRLALAIKNQEIEKKNSDITSSINYARRIQKAMLPLEDRLTRALPEHFILFKPRDIVSGDFYWFSEKNLIRYAEILPRMLINRTAEVRDMHQKMQRTPIGSSEVVRQNAVFSLPPLSHQANKVILAAVDCTGHGVPGAFMSMVGDSMLNHIVNDRAITEPDRILNEMHKGIRKALKQGREEQQSDMVLHDGMDMAICVIDRDNNTLEYAGAKNPLYFIQHGEFHEIKPDKNPIGGQQFEEERIFTKHVVDISIPTTFYIFSDGFQDQFGGEKGKKFMVKRFKELLFDIHLKPMPEQKVILLHTLAEWMGTEHKQVDDILVIGVRLQGR